MSDIATAEARALKFAVQCILFAFGFLPAFVVNIVASFFLPVPLWGALLGAGVVGLCTGIVTEVVLRKAVVQAGDTIRRRARPS